MEPIIAAAASLVALGVSAVIIVLAIRALRPIQVPDPANIVPPGTGERTRTCPSCGAVSRAAYVTCPYCTGQPAKGSLDVRTWGKGKVTALLLATAWTPIYALAFIGFGLVSTVAGIDTLPSAIIPIFLAVHIGTMLLSLVVLVIHVMIAVKSPIPENAKTLWVIAVFFVPFAIPFEFYYLVWRPRKDSGTLSPALLP